MDEFIRIRGAREHNLRSIHVDLPRNELVAFHDIMMERCSAGEGSERMRDASSAIRVEFEREEHGRWLAEVAALSGAPAYGRTRDEAVARVEALALRILAKRLEHGEPTRQFSEQD